MNLNERSQVSDASTSDARPKLVFALVGAAGTRLDDLSAGLKSQLQSFGYRTVDIRLSALLQKWSGWTAQSTQGEAERIRHLQDMGDAFRFALKDGAALARTAIAEIRAQRLAATGSPDRPAPATAYILHQLKHPDEVELLRSVYGPSFLLVAGHAPRKQRVHSLAQRMAQVELQTGHEYRYEAKAIDIITIDEKQEDDFGQNTRDTYPKADFFTNLGRPHGEWDVGRFVDLIFGHPFRTPSHHEYAMYQASAASLRSSDDSRQVGAAIANLTYQGESSNLKNVDIIAVGMNEVPRAGGGFYWETDSPDNRDQALLQRQMDLARDIKVSALSELLQRIQQRGWFSEALGATAPSELAHQLLDHLKRTQFMDIGEFSRPVHAEMAALIDAARRGVAVDGHTMFVTTFPCHNCTKHIIAAGLRKVIYLEPYPKSRAQTLHGEEIELESADGDEVKGKVVFCAYTGTAPRQYRQLFSMSERGAKKGMSLSAWNASKNMLSPRYVTPNSELANLASERQELEKLPHQYYTWDKQSLCP